MKTATEHAKDIRKALKAEGWNSKMVGVRTRNGGIDSAIYITIKDPAVSEKRVKELAAPSSHVDRDPGTGEILGGGNRFVFVQHSHECRLKMAEAWLAPLAEAVSEANEHRNCLVPVRDSGVMVTMEHDTVAVIRHEGRNLYQFYPHSEAGLRDGAFMVSNLAR